MTIDLSSPDHAVKSWWTVLDAQNARGNSTCAKRTEDFHASEEYKNIKAITTGAAHVAQDPLTPCAMDTYGREIVEVKVESDTRAIVLARVKATTPIPPGATPEPSELKRRETGEMYKYLVEKVGKDWKIAQVYQFASWRDQNDPWFPSYSDHPTPRVHSTVFSPQ